MQNPGIKIWVVTARLCQQKRTVSVRKGVWSERAGEAPMSPELEAPLANAVPTSGTTQCLEIRPDTPIIGQRER